jgi:hypothetical protein
METELNQIFGRKTKEEKRAENPEKRPEKNAAKNEIS